MAIRIETPSEVDAVNEFVQFYDRVYEYRSARWPAQSEMLVPTLLGQTAFALEKRMRPFLARDGARTVARVLAVIDERYQRRWNERLGHLMMFEAMPNSREAVKQLMDAACEWLRTEGAEAGRAGYNLVLDFPFAIDDYESLPPSMMRQNPAYYHSLLKDAGFECEKGMVDYKVEVTPQLTARYESALEAVRRADFAIVPLREVPAARRVAEFVPAFNEAFHNHWGVAPARDEVFAELFQEIANTGGLDTSVIAYRGDEVVGCWRVAARGKVR